jgi:hypothetical protein
MTSASLAAPPTGFPSIIRGEMLVDPAFAYASTVRGSWAFQWSDSASAWIAGSSGNEISITVDEGTGAAAGAASWSAGFSGDWSGAHVIGRMLNDSTDGIVFSPTSIEFEEPIVEWLKADGLAVLAAIFFGMFGFMMVRDSFWRMDSGP